MLYNSSKYIYIQFHHKQNVAYLVLNHNGYQVVKEEMGDFFIDLPCPNKNYSSRIIIKPHLRIKRIILKPNQLL